MISNQEQLAKAFYREIGVALGHSTDGTKHEELARMWESYAASVQLAVATGFLLPKITLVALAIGGLLGVAYVLTPAIGFILSILTLVFVALGKVDKWMLMVATWLKARARVADKSLAQTKREVGELLGKLSRPMLIVIDDVDRLSNSDIHLLFQLIKANADFPNMCYLLLLQREVVEKALVATGSTSGRDYLRKIVQVELDVPSSEASKVESVLFSHLDQALEIEKLGDGFDQLRWQRLFGFGLRSLFRSLRDVYRFINTLTFHIGLFRQSERIDINPVDLIGIEALRVFAPDVFRALPKAKGILTGGHGWEANRVEAKAKSKERIEELIKQVEPELRPYVAEILKELFPVVAEALGGMGSNDRDRWIRELRVCASDVFDRYFLLSLPEGDISEEEVNEFLSNYQNRNILVRMLKEAIRSKTLDRLIARLRVHIDELDPALPVPLLTALFDVGDELPRLAPGTWAQAIDSTIWIMIRRYLERESENTKRSQYLASAAGASTGLYLPLVALYFGQGKEDGTVEGDRAPLLVSPEIEQVRSELLNRIRRAAEENTLSKHPQLPFILYRWQDLATESEVREWSNRLISRREGLMEFLKAFAHQDAVTDLMQGGTEIRTRYDLKEVERFVPVARIEDSMGALGKESLSSDERVLVTAFRKAVEGVQDDSIG